MALNLNSNKTRCRQRLDQIQELQGQDQLKDEMSEMVAQKKTVNEIIQYWKQKTQSGQTNQTPQIPQVQIGQNIQPQNNIGQRFTQQPQQQFGQNSQITQNDQIYSNQNFQQSTTIYPPMNNNIMSGSNVVKLSFIFKIDDQNYRKAYANRQYFNETFVLKIRNHIDERARLGTISKDNIEQVLRFSFTAETKCSGGEGKEPLLPDVFQYDLLPSYIIAKWEPLNIDYIFSQNTRFSCDIIVDSSQFQHSSVNLENNDRIKQRQFDNFCKYFWNINNEKVQSFSNQQLKYAVDQTKSHFFAIDSLLNELGQQLQQFTSEVFSSPKGILFFGPPGTGKSAISSKMCQYLEVKLVTRPMAAGDFNKGIVGDSERMLNEIADRAQLIPWETCFLLVDEIDSLAPDRTGSQGQGKDSSLLGVFLAILDGAKQTPNLKIFASTNLREKMDSAFLRRMEIQIFLGNPSALARLEWIKRKSKQAEEKLDHDLKQQISQQEKQQLQKSLNDLKNFVQDDQKKKELQQITLNFSADALRKVLERFFHQIMIGSYFQDNNIMELMRQQVRFTANEMRIRIGKDLVVDIIEQIDDKQNFNKRFEKLFDFIKNDGSFENNEEINLSRRFIIDLSADMEESLQIENKKIKENKSVQEIINKISGFKKDPRMRNKQEDIEDYRFLANKFKEYQHIDQNKGRIKTLNSYRVQFIKNENFQPSGTDFDPLVDYNHLIDSIVQQLTNPPFTNLCYSLAVNYQELQKSWLQFIIVLSTTYIEADCVKLIDANFLYQNNISDDTEASKLIIDTVNQMKEYSKSVVIFDIDSIAGVTKQFSSMNKEIQQPTNFALEDSEGASFSYQKIRPNAMDIALKFGQNLIYQDGMWIFYITKSKMMTLETKNALNFPPTPKEQEFNDLQSEQDIQKRCGRCLSYFTDRDNEEDKCGRHTLQLYRVSQFQQLKHKEQEKQKMLKERGLEYKEPVNEIEIYDKCNKFTKKEVLKVLLKGTPISEFKYICCQKQVFEKGEILCSHQEIQYDNIFEVNLLTDNQYDEL